MKKPMGRGVPAHRTVHESYTNFLKICIFAVARADTKSAKKRMVVRFFERRRQCVKCGEMGVIVPVVSTTRKTTQQGGLFCVVETFASVLTGMYAAASAAQMDPPTHPVSL